MIGKCQNNYILPAINHILNRKEEIEKKSDREKTGKLTKLAKVC